MPVRGFEDCLKELNLIRTENLSTLKGTKVGIDGYPFIRKIFPKEPFTVALGGIPPTLTHCIQKELAKFKAAEITPVFVFNSLQRVRKERPFAVPDKKSQSRTKGWEAYNSKKIEVAKPLWSSSIQISSDVISYVLRVLKMEGIEFFRAPFYSWPQLAWLQQPEQSYISAVYGSYELLMFDIKRLVLDLNFETNSFDWIDKVSVLRDLGLNEEEFIDVCIFSGCDISSTFPPLAETPPFTFRMAVDLISELKNGFSALSHFSNHAGVVQSDYVDGYLRARCLIKNQLVIGKGAKCEPLNKHLCPNDLHEIFGPRLPDSVYFFLSQGIISPQVVNHLTTGVLLESQLLCGDFMEYRDLLDYLTPLKAATIGILANSGLNSMFKSRKIVCIRWFDPFNDHPVDHCEFGEKVNQFLEFPLRKGQIVKEQNRQKEIKSVNLPFTAIMQSSGEKLLKSASVEAENRKDSVDYQPTTIDELLVLSQFYFLIFRKYLTPEGKPTPLSKAVELLKEFPEESMVVMDLVSSGFLTNRSFSTIPVTNSAPLSEDMKSILLISRVFSLVSLECGESGWQGPVDYDILMFHSGVKAFYHSLRNLLEIISMSLMMKEVVKLSVKDYSQLPFEIPFYHEPSPCMGIVIKYFLTRQLDPKAPGDAVQDLLKTFPSCTRLVEDLKLGCRFWKQIVFILTFLKSNGELSASVSQQFEHADELLAALCRSGKLFA